MEAIKEKILSLPKSKEYLITKIYADMVGINVWEEYSEMGYELDDIQDHIYEELIRKGYIKEHREMMIELGHKDRLDYELDKEQSYNYLIGLK